MKHKKLPTQARLKELFDYDPDTGVFTRRIKTGSCTKVGEVAGCKNNRDGYCYISVSNSQYLTHRLVWMYVFGEDPEGLTIDHKNGIRTDNRISNLRLADREMQNQNSHRARGYHFHKASNKYKADICVCGKTKYLGLFDTPEEARAAYLAAKDKYHKGHHLT